VCLKILFFHEKQHIIEDMRRKRVEIRQGNLKRLYEELFKRVDKISKRGQKRGRPRKYKESLETVQTFVSATDS